MTHSTRAVSVAALATAAAAFLSLSCGGSTPAGPPTTTTTTTRPSPTPTPVSCPIGPGSWDFGCARTHSQLLPDVESAMDTLVQTRPQIFDLGDEYAPGSKAYKVLDKAAYMSGLVATLQAAGLCAEVDVDAPGQDAIFVKNSQEFSEEFDVVLSTGYMRRGVGAYRSTCTPATFPVDRPADAPPLGSGCHRPWPPPISRMNCKVNIPGGEYATLDSTPIIEDPVYCLSVGFPPERPDCPVRGEGADDRAACENWRAGFAADTGRPGPTWRKEDGSFCTGPDSGCVNGETQYQLLVYKNGTYTVCAKTGRCCPVVVGRF